jgi:hypothetical protein
MRITAELFILSFLFMPVVAIGARPTIESSQVASHVGSEAVVCGTIIEVRTFSKGVYLNLGASYPREHLGLLVWNDNVPKLAAVFGGLTSLRGKRACARGLLESYKGRVQMKVSDPKALRL